MARGQRTLNTPLLWVPTAERFSRSARVALFLNSLVFPLIDPQGMRTWKVPLRLTEYDFAGPVRIARAFGFLEIRPNPGANAIFLREGDVLLNIGI